jgi:uncharacterized protein (UPF0371 family)
MALSVQIYHEYELGRTAHYAKFETFPVWNLPLNHPVNIAYEAATADLQDANAIDSFHFEAYGRVAINYNRDLQAFPLLRAMLTRITGSDSGYQSPTDMGVNCVAAGIIDDASVCEAARTESPRRIPVQTPNTARPRATSPCRAWKRSIAGQCQS